jgi:hypothetical protein
MENQDMDKVMEMLASINANMETMLASMDTHQARMDAMHKKTMARMDARSLNKIDTREETMA